MNRSNQCKTTNGLYKVYVNLEDMMFLRQDVTMQDFLQDARIITMAEAKQLRRMYGSLGRAGWGILKKKRLDSGFRDMNKLEKEVYLKLGNTAFKGLPRKISNLLSKIAAKDWRSSRMTSNTLPVEKNNGL